MKSGYKSLFLNNRIDEVWPTPAFLQIFEVRFFLSFNFLESLSFKIFFKNQKPLSWTAILIENLLIGLAILHTGHNLFFIKSDWEVFLEFPTVNGIFDIYLKYKTWGIYLSIFELQNFFQKITYFVENLP